MPEPKRLSGWTVVSFESRHAKTLCDLLALQGAQALSAPSLKEVPLEQNTGVFDFAERWFAGRVDVLVLLTGVGTRAMMDVLKARYPEPQVLEQLRRTLVVPRGPKPIRVLQEWKVPYALTVPEPNTWRELIQTMDEAVGARLIAPLQNKTVAVQEYGVTNPELLAALRERGAQVLPVAVYRWTLPDDLGPLHRAIDGILEGKVHGAVFTTAVQIEHALQAAGARAGHLKNALQKIVVASVGPDTSDALRQRGIRPDLEPASPKMGPLIQLLAEKGKDVLEGKIKDRGRLT